MPGRGICAACRPMTATSGTVCEPITGEVVAEVTLDPVAATMSVRAGDGHADAAAPPRRPCAGSPRLRSASRCRVDVDVGARREVGAVHPRPRRCAPAGRPARPRRRPSGRRSRASVCAPDDRVSGPSPVAGARQAGRCVAGGADDAAHDGGADVGSVDGDQHGVVRRPGFECRYPRPHRSAHPLGPVRLPPPDAPGPARRPPRRPAPRRCRRSRRRRAPRPPTAAIGLHRRAPSACRIGCPPLRRAPLRRRDPARQ